jgi:wobble nucleotide-excising tRNase
MINTLQLLRNIGQFDSVGSGATIPLSRLTLIYAENGRGKTTLAAVLRSLASGDPLPITERQRFAAQHPPHVVLDCDGGPPSAMFQSGAWNRTLANLVVFDDLFVDQNIYSGLAVETAHRQNLHELVLGAQGVNLNRKLQGLIARIEEHNAGLREKAVAIPAAKRGALSVDEFCALPSRADIEDAIQATERNLAASREQDPVRNTPLFETLSLPVFDLAAIGRVLDEDLPSLDARAAARVQAHVHALGPSGEAWIGEGMQRLPDQAQAAVTVTCPFCAQDLAGSPVITHYRAYFSAAYADLKRRISEALAELNRRHAADVPVAFERAVRVAIERRQFWSRFCNVPDIAVDTATSVRDWRAVREAVASTLNRKQASPLERMAVSDETRALVATYDTHRATIAALNRQLQDANRAIGVVREQVATANPITLVGDLARLKAIKARHTPEITLLCDDYMRGRSAKTATEEQRDQARAALEQQRTSVFPGYQTATNIYLQRFNAGFRLDSVTSANTRGGPTCTYDVVINSTPVHVGGGEPGPGNPSFRNTLSAGDRNSLALAFFFASLDQDPGLRNKIVVIDDPISSLDDHRALTTVQEIRRLEGQADQVIVLSHNKSFLCRLWEGAAPSMRAALEVARDGTGSTLRAWDVNQDCVTEHDRRHALLREFIATSTANGREVARAIRPTIEAFCRVAYPEHFPAGTLLGPFRNACEQNIGMQEEILSASDTQELRDLLEYANRFHHDTNPAWETEVINDGELRGYVERAMRFATR